MKKIALLFLTRGELLNEEMWEDYLDPSIFNIYIHPDIGYNLTRYKEYQIENLGKKSRGFNILASLELLKESIKDEENYKFVLLSEDCIPLSRNIDFYEYCISDPRSNIRYGDSWIKEGEGRYINEISKSDQKANADWWILNRDNAKSIIKNEKNIVEIYSKYINNGEHAISTILHLENELNKDFVNCKDVLYENYEFIFAGGNYYEFCNEQIDDIKNDLLKRGYFFLRKYYKSNKKNVDFIDHKHWAGIRDYDKIPI
jgi:hypothetical protein